METSNPKLDKYVSGIVAAYIATNRVPRSDLPALIELVARSLQAITHPRSPPLTTEVDKPSESEIEKSIQRDRLIGFVDGKGYKTLGRHLRFHGCGSASNDAPFTSPLNSLQHHLK